MGRLFCVVGSLRSAIFVWRVVLRAAFFVWVIGVISVISAIKNIGVTGKPYNTYKHL